MLTHLPSARHLALHGRHLWWLLALFGLLATLLPALTQPVLSLQTLPDGRVQLRWPKSSAGFVLESASTLTQPLKFQPVTQTPADAGTDFTLAVAAADTTQFYRLRQTSLGFPVTIAATSPTAGEGGVAATRETVIRLDGALAGDTVLGAGSLFAEAAGRRLLTRTELATDRRSVSLFYQEPLPGGARVQVTFDGAGLRDTAGLELDADGDTVPGGTFTLAFDTMNNLAVGQTAVTGKVFASERNPDGTDHPLAGVTVTVDGQEETLRAVTGADGSFVLQPAPAGRFFVHVDGRTAQGSQWPTGAYYPFVGKAWEAVPGKTNNLAGGNGLIYLPFIQPDALRSVSATAATPVTFASSVLATNPALAGVEITVPPNSLFADNGARGGRVGIAPVPPDRLPEPLPAGLNFPLVITIQTDGPSNFDRPVPVRFPNLPDPVTGELLPPGAKTALWSFNHDTGRWEIQGSMTISADGRFAVSDPGVGVLQPGWHGAAPGSGGSGPGGGGGNGDGDCDGPDCDDEPTFADPLGECGRKGAKAFKGTVELATDLLEIGETFKPFNPKKCLGGFLKGAVSALADCALEQFDGDECANDFLEEGFSSTLGCMPYAGGLLKAAWDLGNLENDYREAYESCAGGGGGASEVAPLTGRHGIVRAATGSFPGGYYTALNAAASELGHQKSFAQVSSNLFGTLFGNDRWSGIESPAAAAAWFTFFGAIEQAVAPTGDGGNAVTPAERSALLAGVLPNGATAAEAEALVDRIAALAAGTQFSDAAFRAALGPATSGFLTELAARTGDGWTYALEGLQRALLASTQAQQAMLSYASQTGAARVGGSGDGGSGGSGGSGGAVGGASGGVVQPPRAERAWLLVNLETGFEQRGRLNSAGRFDPVILAPDSFYLVLYSEPERSRVGAAYFMSAAAGQSTTIPTAMMFEDDFPDSDGDRLSNLTERVMGTSPVLGDSDGDGVLDGAEVANRSNPLDSSPLATGVVASVDTPGSALDVAVSGNVAVVADGTAGFSVVDVSDPFAPVLVSQEDLAASPKAVAVAGNRALLAAGSRYYVADFSAPAAPVIVADVALTGANRVAVSGRIGFVTSGAKVRAVDLLSGANLGETTLPATIGDLSLTRDLLLALTQSELRVLRIRQLLPEDPVELIPLGQLAIAGSSAPLEDGRRLFAAGSRAYAGYFQGYSILNLANPAAPELLAKEPATQAAIHDLATDGSGRLLATTSFAGENTLAVSLYDVRGDNDVTRFQASWNTPGAARALALHRGLALVADTSGGLQTVNFAAADTGTNPPTIALEPLLPAPGFAESGGNLRLIANTADDVMVREVEFFLDGVRVALDGANPFEWHGVAPWISTTKTNFTVRARATDTGGNSRWSDELTIALRDTTPLRLVGREPASGFASGVVPVPRVRAQFDGPLDMASVSAGNFTLTNAGPNRSFGDADDEGIPGSLELEPGDNVLRHTPAAPLPTGRYRARLAGGLADRNQVTLGNDLTWDFEVLPPQARTVAPLAGSIVEAEQLKEARAQFDVPMDAATLNATNLLVLTAGPDGAPGNTDDVPVPAAGVSYEPNNRIATWQAVTPLGPGRYTVRLRQTVTGAIGNALTNDFAWGFEVRAPVAWLSDANGLWTTGTNWSGGRVPDRDFVVIDRPNADPLVTVTSQSRSLGWLRSAEALSFSSSSFRLGDDSFIRGAVVLDRSALTATNGLELRGPVTLRRTSELNGVVTVNGPLMLDGAGAKELRQAVTFSGPVTVAEGPLSVVSGVLTLAAGATLDFAPTNAPNANRDQINNGGGSSGTLHNFGVIRHQGGERALLFWGLDVINHSLIEATNGSLGFLSGRFDQNAGARLRAAAPAWFSGVVGEWAGEFRLTGGLFLTNSGVNLRGSLATGDAGLSQHGGTFNVHSPLTLAQLSLRNGVLGIYAPTDITGPARLPGAPEFTGTDRLRFFGDVSLGQVDFRGSLRVENHGRLLVTNGMQGSLHDQVVLVNTPDGEVHLSGNLALLGSSTAAPRIINQGRLRSTAPVSDGDDHTRVWGHVKNSGRIEVEQGRLQLEADSGHDGEITVGAGATLELDSRIGAGGNSTHRFRSASRVSGAGTVELGTASIVLEGTWDITNTWLRSGRLVIPGNRQMAQLRVSAGELEPHGLLDLTGVLDATGGAIRPPGVVRLSGQFAAPTNRFPGLAAGGRFELASSVEMTSMGSMFSEAGGTWRLLPGAELRADSAGFTGAGAFLNEGRLVTGATNAALSFGVSFTNSGVLAVQGGTMTFQRLFVQDTGQTRLEGGALRIGSQSAGPTSGVLLHGGEFLGAGLVDGLSNWPFTNSAVLRPGLPIGQLTMDLLRYTQTTNGVLEIELGGRTPGTEHDQLVLTGDLRQLAGTLDVKLINGFVPDIGDRFHIVNADWQRGIIGPNNLDDGEFTTVNFPALPAGRRWQIVYNRISAPAHPGVELRVIAGP